MTERPILFKSEMVRAILSGKKTMTRRIIKPQYVVNDEVWTSIKRNNWMYQGPIINNEILLKVCPYGNPGDILWVKETFYALGKWVKNGTTKTGKQKYRFTDLTLKMGHKYMYDVESEKPAYIETQRDGLIHWYKRPSIFMPKVASRIRLEVTDRRVERLQEITEADANGEGAERGIYRIGPKYTEFHLELNHHASYKDGYKFIWESIHSKDSWNLNPYVWVVTFRDSEGEDATERKYE